MTEGKKSKEKGKEKGREVGEDEKNNEGIGEKGMIENIGSISSIGNIGNKLVNGDGVLDILYHFLWLKDDNNLSARVPIPNTIIYKYQQPHCWYFTCKEGFIRKKNKQKLTSANIERCFLQNKDNHDIVAYFIYSNVEGTHSIQYFSREEFLDFLYDKSKHREGILQNFIEPKGPKNCKYSMIHVTWSSNICLLERRTNLLPLHSRRNGAYDRAVTFEGAESSSVAEPIKGSILTSQIERLCNEIDHHIVGVTSTNDRIQGMVLMMKTDDKDNCWFLWCSSLRIQNETVRKPVDRNPIDLARTISIPKHIPLKTLPQQSCELHVVYTNCGSCSKLIDKAKVSPTYYKYVVLYHNHILHELGYSIDIMLSSSEEQLKSLIWPPDLGIIGGSGGTGFGILKLMKKTDELWKPVEILIPPPIRYIYPTLAIDQYQRLQKDLSFLFNEIQSCESCFLTYTDLASSALDLKNNTIRSFKYEKRSTRKLDDSPTKCIPASSYSFVSSPTSCHPVKMTVTQPSKRNPLFSDKSQPTLPQQLDSLSIEKLVCQPISTDISDVIKKTEKELGGKEYRDSRGFKNHSLENMIKTASSLSHSQSSPNPFSLSLNAQRNPKTEILFTLLPPVRNQYSPLKKHDSSPYKMRQVSFSSSIEKNNQIGRKQSKWKN